MSNVAHGHLVFMRDIILLEFLKDLVYDDLMHLLKWFVFLIPGSPLFVCLSLCLALTFLVRLLSVVFIFSKTTWSILTKHGLIEVKGLGLFK